jgi:hypothetical protein
MTATLDPTGVLVPLEDVRRHLGYPKGEVAALLREQAAAHGLALDVRDDWAGRPCVPEAQARALAAAVIDAREQALAAKRARNREGEVRALALQRRCEQRADLCYSLALDQFGDPGIAIRLAHQAASQATSDESLSRQFDAIGVRWQQGFRTLAPEPGRGDRDDDFPLDLDELHGREWLRQSLNDTIYKPIPPVASKRLREIIRGRAR